jgi:hypothetical protein
MLERRPLRSATAFQTLSRLPEIDEREAVETDVA